MSAIREVESRRKRQVRDKVQRLPVPATVVETPTGSVEVIIYGGGYNPSTHEIGLGRFHNHGTELVLPEGVDPETLPGITVIDIPSAGKLFWNNTSISQPVQLAPDQVKAVQEGLQEGFPGREVIFDPDNFALRRFYEELKGA